MAKQVAICDSSSKSPGDVNSGAHGRRRKAISPTETLEVSHKWQAVSQSSSRPLAMTAGPRAELWGMPGRHMTTVTELDPIAPAYSASYHEPKSAGGADIMASRSRPAGDLSNWP